MARMNNAAGRSGCVEVSDADAETVECCTNSSSTEYNEPERSSTGSAPRTSKLTITEEVKAFNVFNMFGTLY